MPATPGGRLKSLRTAVLLIAHFGLRLNAWYLSKYTDGYATSILSCENILFHTLSGVSCRLLNQQNLWQMVRLGLNVIL